MAEMLLFEPEIIYCAFQSCDSLHYGKPQISTETSKSYADNHHCEYTSTYYNVSIRIHVQTRYTLSSKYAEYYSNRRSNTL